MQEGISKIGKQRKRKRKKTQQKTKQTKKTKRKRRESLPERRYRRNNRNKAAVAEQTGDFCHTANVFVSILLREAEILRKPFPEKNEALEN